MSIISTKKLLISLILLMGIMMIGMIYPAVSVYAEEIILEKDTYLYNNTVEKKKMAKLPKGTKVTIEKYSRDDEFYKATTYIKGYVNGKVYKTNFTELYKVEEDDATVHQTPNFSKDYPVALGHVSAGTIVKNDRGKYYIESFKTIGFIMKADIDEIGTLTFKGATDSDVAKAVIGVPNVIKADAEGYVTIPTTTPKREGYEFKSWAVFSNGQIGRTSYQPGDKVKVGDFNMVVVSQWEKIGKEYKITYNANGGKFSDGKGAIVVSQDYSLDETPTKTGYKFLGWAENNKATTAKYANSGDVKKIESTITVYAVWKKQESKPTQIPATESQNNKLEINITDATSIMKNGNTNKEVKVYDWSKNQIATICSGQPVFVQKETKDGYYEVFWNVEGYAHKNYVKKEQEEYGTTIGVGPNIRKTASQNGTLMGDVKAGQGLNIVGEEGKYYKVTTGLYGYIEKNAIVLENNYSDDKTDTNNKTDINLTGNIILRKLFGFAQQGISLGKEILNTIVGDNSQKTEESPISKLLNTFKELIGTNSDEETKSDDKEETLVLEVGDALKFTAESYYLYSDKDCNKRIGKVLVTEDKVKVLEINENKLKVEIKEAKNLEIGAIYYIKYNEKYFDIIKAEKDETLGGFGTILDIMNNKGENETSSLLTGGLKFLNTIGKGISQIIVNAQTKENQTLNFLKPLIKGTQILFGN